METRRRVTIQPPGMVEMHVADDDRVDGRGVDPETFAGLYAGQAIAKFGKDLKTDERGRLTYKDKVVRMYSISRIKKLYSSRAKLASRKNSGN